MMRFPWKGRWQGGVWNKLLAQLYKARMVFLRVIPLRMLRGYLSVETLDNEWNTYMLEIQIPVLNLRKNLFFLDLL